MKFINSAELSQEMRGAQPATFLLIKQVEASPVPLLRQ
jgi:hypothetical protein